VKKYSLRFAADTMAGERVVRFYAHSTSNALDLAKESAHGDWAELSDDETIICRMKLVEETGVWLIEPAKNRDGQPR